MRTAFFWWPAGWASGHASYQASLLDQLLRQDRHEIVVIADESASLPDVRQPHQVVTFKAVARRAARFTVLDYGTERPALRAVKRCGARAVISNAAFVAPRPRDIPVLSIVYETDFFDPSPWHWFDSAMIQRMATYTARGIADAAAVFGISQHTVHRVITEFGVRPERARLAYPAVAASAPRSALVPLGQRYVAQVGWFHPRKDLSLVIDAWSEAFREGLARDLLLIGRPGPHDRVLGSLARQVMERAGSLADHVHIAGYVSRDRYLSLLAEADALVAGSRQEGFCIPIVEAFALGTPVVAVDRTALSEVAGPVGTLTAPSPRALAGGILAAVTDPPSAVTLKDYAGRFTPEAQAAPFLAVLDAIEEQRWR